MPSILIFILLGCACFFILANSSFFNLEGCSKLFVGLLFSCKLATGLWVAYHSPSVFNGNDGYFYFEAGKTFQLYALQHPISYFKLLFSIDHTALYAYYVRLLNWKNLPVNGDGETLIKINSLIHFFSFSGYYTHVLLFCFFSFCGITGIYKSVCLISQTNSKLLLTALLIFPSCLLFTSGVLKETLLAGTAGLFIFHILLFKKSKSHALAAIAFGSLLLLVKPHFIFLLLPVVAAFVVNRYLQVNRILQVCTYFIIVLLYLTAASCLVTFMSGKSISYTLALAQQSAMKNSIFTKANSFSKPPIIAASLSSVSKNTPAAFYHALSLPAFRKTNSLLINLAAMENLLIVTMLLLSLTACFLSANSYFSYHLAIIIFIFLFYSIIGLTQALEAIILRFKAPVLPLLISGVYLLVIPYRNKKSI